MTNVKNAKNANSFYCDKCDFTCFKLSNWHTHTTTRKHKIRTNTYIYEDKNCQKMPTHNKVYTCNCSKIFKHASSLWNHKQKCVSKQESVDNEQEEVIQDTNETLPEVPSMSIFVELLKQNQELQKQLIEAVKTGGQHIENQTNINNNQKFNLNFFLNEQCKDAINMSEFIENMELDLEDLTETCRLGYVGGISRILINKLQELDIYKRPLHCTDVKRETLYIKENNEWEKQANSKDKMSKIIGQVANKNCRNLPRWTEEHPGYEVFDSPQNMEYMNMTQAILGGFSEEENKQFKDKIIRSVIKEVMINKI